MTSSPNPPTGSQNAGPQNADSSAVESPAALEVFLIGLDAASERVRKVIEPVIDGEQCELVLLQVRRQPRSTTVRVFADVKGDETIGIAKLQALNRELGDILDVEDAHSNLFPGTWDLEVSSPGIDRPLTKRSHFEKAVGQTVKIKGRNHGGNRVTLKGKLEAISKEGITVVDDSGDSSGLSFAEINDAIIQFDFGTTSKPTPKRKKKKAKDGASDQDVDEPSKTEREAS